MSSQDSGKYEIVLLGDWSVGKTSLFLRLKHDRYVDPNQTAQESGTVTTIGVDTLEKTVTVDGQEITARLHDTGGGEKYRTLTSNFYRYAKAVILVYSVEDRYTFTSLSDWITECFNNNSNPSDLVFAIVANKSDLQNEVEVDSVKAFCAENEIRLFFATSALTGKNVDRMFQDVVAAIHGIEQEKGKESTSETSNKKSIKVTNTSIKVTSTANNSGGCKC